MKSLAAIIGSMFFTGIVMAGGLLFLPDRSMTSADRAFLGARVYSLAGVTSYTKLGIYTNSGSTNQCRVLYITDAQRQRIGTTFQNETDILSTGMVSSAKCPVYETDNPAAVLSSNGWLYGSSDFEGGK